MRSFFQKKSILFVSLFIPMYLTAALPESKADAVVLGGGVGGLTSAVYLARAGAVPLVIEGKNPGGAIAQSKGVQNWPGDLEISGIDLIEKIREQAKKNGAILSEEEMVSIDLSSKPFSMVVQDVYNPAKQRKIVTDVCIIAMGAQARTLGVEGEKKYESKGVYTCAVCDGPLYKDKTVAVIGGGDSAVLEADYLCGVAKKVYLIVRGKELKGVEFARREQVLQKENLQIIYDAEVQKIEGSEQSVEKVIITRGSGEKESIDLDAVFLAIGATPNTGPFVGQLELDNQGYIVCKNHMETSVPAVFAVGDVKDPVFKQAVSAGGEGAKAAIQAQPYLASRRKRTSKQAASEQAQGTVIEVTSLDHLNHILKSNTLPVIIDFYASWCSPCRSLSSHVNSWAKELEGRVVVCKVNVDSAREVSSLYQIKSMPTVVHLDSNRNEIARKVGTTAIINHVNSLK